jgi:hypothetical protein
LTRELIADYDQSGLFVYQAFKPDTVAEAARQNRFGRGFTFDRLTWIKPSFGWVLHRSEYARKHRMEAIARIKISHAGFLEILGGAVSTSFEGPFAGEAEWRLALSRSLVRYQWDPDYDLFGRPLSRRALQLGLRGAIVRRYVEEFTLAIEDATALAHELEAALIKKSEPPAVYEERPYPLSPELRARLAMEA